MITARLCLPLTIFQRLFVACGLLFGCGILADSATAEDAEFRPERCEVVPLPDHQVSFCIDGQEKLRWHFGSNYPRPFFYPLNGPSGVSLTRMGHPGAQNHDHHRSIWFAHQALADTDFWSDNGAGRVAQKFWYSYQDGNDEAVMASALSWRNAQDQEVMHQDLTVAVMPLAADEHAVELQITLLPGSGMDSVTLDQTNFGLLAIRVSKTLSAFFGGGQISDSEGRQGEQQIFGKQARWMDYSGPVVVGSGAQRHVVTEGITCFDHPENPRHPSFWHVRSDGWMGASFGMQSEYQIERHNPLILRYLLHAHQGHYNADKALKQFEQFRQRAGFEVRQALPSEQHRQYVVERLEKQASLPDLPN